MGWGIWAGPHGCGNNEKPYTLQEVTTRFGGDAPLFNWLLLNWHWAGLKPEEGKYTWGDFDQVVKYWARRDKQIVVRWWVTDNPGWAGRPGKPLLPDWVWEKGIRFRQYRGNGGTTVRELDSLDPSFQQVYLPLLRKLLASFAERYDKPGTPVIMLQVMGYGDWADWATWFSRYRFPNRGFKHDLLAKIMKVYIGTFKHIRLFEFAGADWNGNEMTSPEEHMYNKALDVAVAHGFGLIWTGFIDGLRGWDTALMEKYWRANPIIAEGNWNYDDMMDQRRHGTLEENLDMMRQWHANFGHFYLVADTYKRAMRENRAFFESGLKAHGLGYRLVPTSVGWREELPASHLLVLKQTWVNRNVGRLYVKHPLKLYLTDSAGNEKFSEANTAFDATTWVQGDTYSVNSVFHLP